MTDLHLDVEKMIEAGPQRFSTCPMCGGSAKRVSRGFTGKEATHGCRVCNATGRMVETPEEFARRIALLADKKAREEQREEDAKVCEELGQQSEASAEGYEGACAFAIRRGKP